MVTLRALRDGHVSSYPAPLGTRLLVRRLEGVALDHDSVRRRLRLDLLELRYRTAGPLGEPERERSSGRGRRCPTTRQAGATFAHRRAPRRGRPRGLGSRARGGDRSAASARLTRATGGASRAGEAASSGSVAAGEARRHRTLLSLVQRRERARSLRAGRLG